MNPTPLTARNPVDLIAMAPVMLGFHPEDSVVILSLGMGSFHARIDMPVDEDEIRPVVQRLVRPIARHQVDSVVVLLYSQDEAVSQRVAVELLEAILDTGAGVVEVIRVDDDCYHLPLEPERDPVPYDISNHRFMAEAVLLGQQTLGSRTELEEMLVCHDPEEIDRVIAASMATAGMLMDRVATARWIQEVLGRHLDTRDTMSTEDAGRFLLALCDIDLRDVAWSAITPESAGQAQDLLVDLVRRAPVPYLPPVSALLAFTAWLRGNGALAWCALDRCFTADPDYSLGAIIAGLLESATPPWMWEALDTSELRVFVEDGNVPIDHDQISRAVLDALGRHGLIDLDAFGEDGDFSELIEHEDDGWPEDRAS